MAVVIPFPTSQRPRRSVRPVEDCISKVREAIRILEDHSDQLFCRRRRMPQEEIFLLEDLGDAIEALRRGRPRRGLM